MAPNTRCTTTGRSFCRAAARRRSSTRCAALPAVDAALFDATQRAALQLAVEMTRDVKVGDATFDAARRALGSDRHLFELIGVIAAYNMVSRILVAVGVEAND